MKEINSTNDNASTNLNEIQEKAVHHTEGPLLILAGAGTGKTHVLTERVRFILNSGLTSANHLMIVTFTNKAALELKERLHEFSIPYLGTFHRIFLRILKTHAQKIDLSPYFSILNTDEQARVMKEVLEEANLDIKRFAPQMLLWNLERFKDKGIGPQDSHPKKDSYSIGGVDFSLLYQSYQDRLKKLNAVDFGDLLYYPLKIFMDYPEVLDSYQQKMQYILVDEYQDTNTIQYKLLKLLSMHWKNICCVGDDDQSIYSWRGADIDNILQFEKDYPNAEIIRLEANYRSTSNILKVAKSVIDNNTQRLGKNLYSATWTEQSYEEPVRVYSTWSSKDESDLMAELIQAQPPTKASVAILVRMTAQTREIEESLLKYNIPYRLVGSIKFYEREEIRDMLAYLKYLLTGQDLALLRIINKPSRKIGPNAINALRKYAKEQNISLYEGLLQLNDSTEFPSKYIKNFQLFVNLTKQLQSILMKTSSLSEGVWELFQATGLYDRYEDEKQKIDNVKEMLKGLQEFETFNDYLEHVSLMMDVQDYQTDSINTIKVMTLHAAKGLEFDYVYLPGWEEGLFPSARALEDSIRNLEEERRLAYVGITRGKKQVIVLYALNRTMYGRYTPTLPSRFLKEFPKEHIKFIDVKPKSASLYHHNSFYKHNSMKSKFTNNRGFEKSFQHVTFRIGQDCQHKVFGHGVVLSLEGDRIRVHFDNGQERIILESYLQNT